MSIQGIHSGYAAQAFAPRAVSAPPAAINRPADAQAPVRGAAAERSLPVGVPERTDSSLWGVLTSDERSFFARVNATGSMTYGPGTTTAASPSVSLGGRIDLKA